MSTYDDDFFIEFSFFNISVIFELDPTTSRPPTTQQFPANQIAILWWHVASKKQARLFDPCVLRCYNKQRNESCDSAVLLGDWWKHKPLKKTALLAVPSTSSRKGLGVSYFTLLIDACWRYFKILKCFKIWQLECMHILHLPFHCVIFWSWMLHY